MSRGGLRDSGPIEQRTVALVRESEHSYELTRSIRFGGALATSVLLGTLALPAASAYADLGDYLAQRDQGVGCRKRSEENASGIHAMVLDLTSQIWRGSKWSHELRVFRPAAPRADDLAILVISGEHAGWRRDFEWERALAGAAGVPVAVLSDIPNQPLFFGRREDDLVAHTFSEFLRTGEEDWPLLFPMTKAAVKAMDAVAELSGREWGRTVERFVVTGASKRGWTSWLAAAGDSRVVGVVPVVFDNLNFRAQMSHQVAVWGTYSDELRDYTWRGLQEQMDSERGARLVAMVDPFAYRERLARVRKLVVNGTNDPYWPLDAVGLYWRELGGEKSVLYVPNGRHGIASEVRVMAATAALVGRIAAGRPMPSLELELQRRGASLAVRVVSNDGPLAARLWIAHAPSRDFRRSRFESIDARPEAAGFIASTGLPPDGFVALFAEADYDQAGRRFQLSTPIRVEAAEESFPP